MDRCQECGFDWGCTAGEVLAEIGRWGSSYRAGLTRLLPGEDGDVLIRTRPASGVWSALEYTVHVRDVANFYLDRMRRVLAEDRPTMDAVDFGSMAEERKYNGEDVEDVITRLTDSASSAAEVLGSLEPEEWDRVGVGSEGSERTVLVLSRRLAHDGHHLLLDLGRVLRAVRQSR